MINFDEELKKFHPCLEIKDAEELIYNQDLDDVGDVIVKLMKQADGQIPQRRMMRRPGV